MMGGAFNPGVGMNYGMCYSLPMGGANAMQGMQGNMVGMGMPGGMQRGMQGMDGMQGGMQGGMARSAVGQPGGVQGPGYQVMHPWQGMMNQLQMQEGGQRCGEMEGTSSVRKIL